MLAPPSLYRTHPTAGEECPPLLAIVIQAGSADISEPCQFRLQQRKIDSLDPVLK
jgi:hypothetical protein